MTNPEKTTRVLAQSGGILLLADFESSAERRSKLGKRVETEQIRVLNLHSGFAVLESVRVKWTYDDMDFDVSAPRFTVIAPGEDVPFLNREAYEHITNDLYDREPVCDGLFSTGSKVWTLNFITLEGPVVLEFEAPSEERPGNKRVFLFDLSPAEST